MVIDYDALSSKYQFIELRKLEFVEENKMKDKKSESNKVALGLMGGLVVGAILNSVALGLIGGLLVGSLPSNKNKEKK